MKTELVLAVAAVVVLGCSRDSESASRTKRADALRPPPQLHADYLVQPDLDPNGLVVGSPNGVASVGASGDAQYKIPLWVSPGPRSLEPELVLSYSSARERDGIAGRGWFLSGARNEVSRCEKDRLRDGLREPILYSNLDGFCLNGVRLEQRPGEAFFRPENNATTIVRMLGSGNQISFEVVRKGGRDVYGSSANSRLEGPQLTTTVPASGDVPDVAEAAVVQLSWAIESSEDLSKGRIEYHYSNQKTSHGWERLLSSVTYGQVGALSREVRFVYEDRWDARTAWVSGLQVGVSSRLKRVESLYRGQTVRSHELTYYPAANLVPDLLKSVQECDGQGACRPAIDFSYSHPSRDFAMKEAFDGLGSVDSVQTGDVNGDGCADLIVGTTTAVQGVSVLKVVEAADCGLPTRHFDVPGAYLFPVTVNRRTQGLQVVDVNGDGADDLVLTTSGLSYPIYLATLTSLSADVYLGGMYQQSVHGTFCSRFSCGAIQLPGFLGFSLAGTVAKPQSVWADVDGDGRLDLITRATNQVLWHRNRGVVVTSPAVTGAAIFPLFLEAPLSLPSLPVDAMRLVDANCDGRSELLARNQTSFWATTAEVQLGNQAPVRSVSYQWPKVEQAFFVDATGSGCPQALSVDETSGIAQLSQNIGGSFLPKSQAGFPAVLTATATSADLGLRTSSVSGLGTELLQVDTPGHQSMWLTSFFRDSFVWQPLQTSGGSLPVFARNAQDQLVGAVGDIDGDGYDEVIRADGPVVTILGTLGVAPFSLLSATRPGIQEEFAYSPSIMRSVHPTVASATNDVRPFLGGVWLVASLRRDAAGLVREKSYTYHGGSFAREGNRFKGFDHVDERERTTTRQSYFDDFEKAGVLLARQYVTTELEDGGTVEDRTQISRTQLSPWGFLVESSVSSEHREGSILLTSSTKTTEYGPSAEATAVTIQYLDGSSEREDAPNWLIEPALGRYVPIDTQHLWVDSSGVTEREVRYHIKYDGDSDRPSSIERSPGATDSTWARTSITYDPGSLGTSSITTCESVRGRCATRNFIYDSVDFQFVVGSVNEEGHQFGFAYDPARGTLLVSEDENAVRTELQIDTFGAKRLHRSLAGGWASFHFNSVASGGVKVDVVGADGSQRSETYDVDGNALLSVWKGESGLYGLARQFNERGLSISEELPHPMGAIAAKRHFIYDQVDRLMRVEDQDPTGFVRSTPLTRSYQGSSVVELDAMGRNISRKFDRRGRLSSTTQTIFDASNGQRDLVVSYVRNVDGSLRETAFGGVHRFYNRDILGRSTGGVDPDRGTSTVSLDGFDRVLSVAWSTGEIVSFERDLLGRPLFIDDGNIAKTFLYDASPNGIGRLSTASNSVAEWAFGYDSFGRESTATLNSNGQTLDFRLVYDVLGRPAGRVLPKPSPSALPLSLKYEYGLSGSLIQVNDLNGLGAEWRLLQDGEFGLRQESFGPTSYERRFDNNTGLPRWESLGVGGVPLFQQAFEYNDLGELKSRHDRVLGATEDFSYDDLGRLVRWGVIQSCGERAQVYQYDDLSNLRLVSVENGGLLTPVDSYEYNDSDSPFRQTAHDDLARGARDEFVYDGLGRQIRFGRSGMRKFSAGSSLPYAVSDDNGKSTSYEEDPLGTRLWSHFDSYDELHLGAAVRMVWSGYDYNARFSIGVGSGSFEIEWTPSFGYSAGYRLSSAEGTPQVDFSIGGVVVRRYKQEPFGAETFSHSIVTPSTTLSVSGGVGMAGSRWETRDQSRVMGARTYSPSQRRFASPDPVDHGELRAEAYNPFVYGYNSPDNYPDPSGLDPYDGRGQEDIPIYGDAGPTAPPLVAAPGDAGVSAPPLVVVDDAGIAAIGSPPMYPVFQPNVCYDVNNMSVGDWMRLGNTEYVEMHRQRQIVTGRAVPSHRELTNAKEAVRKANIALAGTMMLSVFAVRALVPALPEAAGQVAMEAAIPASRYRPPAPLPGPYRVTETAPPRSYRYYRIPVGEEPEIVIETGMQAGKGGVSNLGGGVLVRARLTPPPNTNGMYYSFETFVRPTSVGPNWVTWSALGDGVLETTIGGADAVMIPVFNVVVH